VTANVLLVALVVGMGTHGPVDVDERIDPPISDIGGTVSWLTALVWYVIGCADGCTGGDDGPRTA
jgi:hypothetical protein